MAAVPTTTSATPTTTMATTPTTTMATATTGPPSLVLPSMGRAQTLHIVLNFYMNMFEDLHQRMAMVEMALLTKGKTLEMEAQGI
jgi:hypothetical protein